MCARFCGTAEEEKKHDNAGNSAEKTDGTERGFSASCPAPTGSPTGAANFQTAPFLPQKSHHSLSERIDIASEPDDGEVLEEIDRLILGEEETRYLPVAQKAELRRQLFYSVRRLDVLQELLEDAGITKIMVNGYQHIFVERNGRIDRKSVV